MTDHPAAARRPGFTPDPEDTMPGPSHDPTDDLPHWSDSIDPRDEDRRQDEFLAFLAARDNNPPPAADEFAPVLDF